MSSQSEPQVLLLGVIPEGVTVGPGDRVLVHYWPESGTGEVAFKSEDGRWGRWSVPAQLRKVEE